MGPTATGKSALALRLCSRLEGAVIVSADSRQVYRGLDVGTAKPSREERQRVPHRLIDVVDPDQSFSLADYQRLAYMAIDSAKRPFLVGGTGLYVRAVVDGFVLPPAPPDAALRAGALDSPALLNRLQSIDPDAAVEVDTANPYRLLRLVERAGHPPEPTRPRYDVLQIGLTAPREVLYQRSDERVDRMLAEGWLEEVRGLLKRYPYDLPAFTGLGYRELIRHVRDELSLEETIALVKRRTRQFIKRQQTWFKRDYHVHWLDITQPGWIARAIEMVGTVWRM